jgi:hypothetical protein
MYLAGYSVEIAGGTNERDGYVTLDHNQQYTITLHNYKRTKCDAEVYIDGKHIDTFRINRNDAITLERPTNDTGRFTFLTSGTIESIKAGVDHIPAKDRGLISVTFYPEHYKEEKTIYPMLKNMDDTFLTCSSVSYNSRSGGTGLSGKSNQEFISVGKIDRNYDESVTINIRLIQSKHGSVRPLKGKYATPIPSPV